MILTCGDFVSADSNMVGIEELVVQKGLAHTWKKVEPGMEIHVVLTIEDVASIVQNIKGEV